MSSSTILHKLNNLYLWARFWNHRRKVRRNELAKAKTQNSNKNRLCVLGTAKNEALNLAEWVEHYAQQGADKVFLIDNGSTDNSMEVISSFLSSGFVEVVSLPQKHKQVAHYWEAFQKFQVPQLFEWMLVADVDEFWFCKDGAKLVDALEQFDDVDVVYANWTVFGTSGHKEHPNSLRKNLVKRKPGLSPHKWRKYLVRTSVPKKLGDIGVHYVRGADSCRTISDNETFQINHYQFQSLHYWQNVKLTRGDADKFHQDHSRKLQHLIDFDKLCTELDTQLADRLRSLES
ncbi:glycosyltransferase family 92 protein [Ruegeria lacuscaerulensis]|uniref:glycosyltransferase family 92 protein n=1 Tax=Ruegeria lacuscaerulensis TaxID=55218 RepID=UPI00147B0889|nr:glycosyltransferase family 92 protein [Ruegeria lacuscaerulensis]